MIAVERCAPPVSLSSDRSRKERDDAVNFFSDPANRQGSFSFKAYRAEDVKLALHRLFKGKCAYCETFFAAGGPLDTEHYRPKSEWSDGAGTVRRPGYYWLAASWDNLLPSCWDCNRKRGHAYPDGHRVTGKAIQFPLLDEGQRADAPGGETNERPYLLDPCRDDPDEHLEFAGDGAIRPVLRDGDLSTRGAKTIEILGLHRPNLAKGRMYAFLGVKAALRHFQWALEALDRDPDDETKLTHLREEMEELRRLMDDEAPYAGMARQRIMPFLTAAGALGS
jgi:uncharacterized protein (TIGR02646 family)